MAQFDLYGADEDCTRLLSLVFSRGDIEVVPGLNYPSQAALTFDSDSPELKRCLRLTRLVFLRGAKGDRRLSFQHRDDGTFVVSEDQSGDLMTLFLPGIEKAHDGLLLRPGSLSYPSLLWNKDYSKAARPSQELKNAFQKLRKQFKTCLVKLNLGGALWVGVHAHEHLLKGKAKILAHGKWWTLRNAVARRDARTGR